MRLLDKTLSTEAENLALDEALLESVTELGAVLRLWEPRGEAVILGRGSRYAGEVHFDACHDQGIPILRRCSGGATVMTLPGCLMYAVVLPAKDYPELADVERAHRFVLLRLREAYRQLGLCVQLAGSSDLVWQGRKFSGNSLRCKREGLLYHGTLLYKARLERIARCLKMPSRQPDYRQRRPHQDFLINVPVDVQRLRHTLCEVWQAHTKLETWPGERTRQLAAQRYSLDSWNLQR